MTTSENPNGIRAAGANSLNFLEGNNINETPTKPIGTQFDCGDPADFLGSIN